MAARSERQRLSLSLCICLSLTSCSSITFERGATRGEAANAGVPATPPAGGSSAPQASVAPAVASPTAPRAAAVPTAAPSPQPTPVATVAVDEPDDPNALVRVASWWKLGGTPASLDAAIDACVATLGVAHRPQAGATRVTLALRECLRDRGWRALAAAAAP